jgi:hypothetical protein
MLKDVLAMAAVESVTEVVKLKLPLCDVVPEIIPVLESSDNPFGNVPLVICQRYGVMPPVADRFVLYGAPTVPAGRVRTPIPSFNRGVTVTCEVATTRRSQTLTAVTVTLVDAVTDGAV